MKALTDFSQQLAALGFTGDVEVNLTEHDFAIAAEGIWTPEMNSAGHYDIGHAMTLEGPHWRIIVKGKPA